MSLESIPAHGTQVFRHDTCDTGQGVRLPARLDEIPTPVFRVTEQTHNIKMASRNFNNKLFLINETTGNCELYDIASSKNETGIIEPLAVQPVNIQSSIRPVAFPNDFYLFMDGDTIHGYKSTKDGLQTSHSLDRNSINPISKILNINYLNHCNFAALTSDSIVVYNIADMSVAYSLRISPNVEVNAELLLATNNRQFFFEKHIKIAVFNFKHVMRCSFNDSPEPEIESLKWGLSDKIQNNKARVAVDDFNNIWVGTEDGYVKAYSETETLLFSQRIGEKIHGISVGNKTICVHYLRFDMKTHIDRFSVIANERGVQRFETSLFDQLNQYFRLFRETNTLTSNR